MAGLSVEERICIKGRDLKLFITRTDEKIKALISVSNRFEEMEKGYVPGTFKVTIDELKLEAQTLVNALDDLYLCSSPDLRNVIERPIYEGYSKYVPDLRLKE